MADETTNPDPVEQTMADSAIDAVEQAEVAAEAIRTETATPEEAVPFDPPVVEGPAICDEDGSPTLALLNDVALKVKIELGRTRMYVEDVLRLTPESVIELDKAAGDPVDIFVNERLVARGEVLVLNENFCVRISEIVDNIETEASVP